MLVRIFHLLLGILSLAFHVLAQDSTPRSSCKVAPNDVGWPSYDDWAALNDNLGGALIRSTPVASSCFSDNPFGVDIPCNVVQAQWTNASFHRSLPESIDFPIFANRSCIPEGQTGGGLLFGGTCTIGAYPVYVLDAISADQIAVALQWAASKYIRVVIKGTGHDLAGRSTGAHSLSIWTHSLRGVVFDTRWRPDGASVNTTTYQALKVGSGMTWGEVYEAAHYVDKVVVGGGSPSVGLGGHIGGGGHGPLTFDKGLASDNVLQATVVTTTGQILVANDYQNTDLFWAIRGGGPGVYGVVTEFVLKTYPSPNVTMATIQIQSGSTITGDSADAALAASGIVASQLDDWMDAGITGTFYAATGATIAQFVKDIDVTTMLLGRSPVTYVPLFAFNSTPDHMNATIFKTINLIQRTFGKNLIVKYQIPRPYSKFYYWFKQFEEDMKVGFEGVQSSRLLTKTHMTGNLQAHIQRILRPKSSIIGSVLVLDMVGGKGPASIAQDKRSGLNPAWRESYIHAIANTAIPNSLTTWSAQKALEDTGKWINDNTEPAWDTWAPGAGAYMHEANQFSPKWKEQFFGENYDRLFQIKKKYDPSETLFVEQGVGSHLWTYDMNSGRLCQA